MISSSFTPFIKFFSSGDESLYLGQYHTIVESRVPLNLRNTTISYYYGESCLSGDS